MAAGSTTPTVFDCREFDRSDRFEAYRQLYAAGSTVEPAGPRFRARVDVQRLDRLVLFERRLRGVTHARSAQRIRRDGFEHFTLQLNHVGRICADVPGGTRDVAPGQIILFDSTQPQLTRIEQAHFLTFSVARDLVEAASSRTAGLHGRVLSGPQAGLLADLMTSLVRRRIADEPEAASGAVRMFREALTLALNADHLPDPEGPDDAFQRVKVLIEHHLSRRELSPAWLANRAGLSRTRLYDVFKTAGGISRYIQQRRAARLRALLRRPDMRHFNVGDLSLQVGFASESHASRTFSEHVGLSPGQYRRTVQEAGNAAPLGRPPSFADWIEALN